MTDMAADLATRGLAMLRAILSDYQDVISGPDVQRGMDAVDRVEAELARLTEAAQFAGVPAWTRLYQRAEAAERALADADRVGTSAWSEKVLREREEAVRALAETREALRLVRDWIREGKGSESEAAEAMDAALAASAPQEPYEPTAQEWADAHAPQEPQP